MAARREADIGDLPLLVARLSDAECRVVLAEAAAAGAEVPHAIRNAAVNLLAACDHEQIASEVAEDLTSMPHTDLADRSGRVPGRGYVDPTDAAWELLEEAIQVWITDIERRAATGMPDVAAAVTLAIVDGLRRCEPAPVETVLDWAPDAPEHFAQEVLRRAAAAGAEVDREQLGRIAPDWFG